VGHLGGHLTDVKRFLHLNHHKVSGTETDMEERAITNGEPWGFARLLMVGDNVMSAFIRILRAKTWTHKLAILKRSLLVYAPLALLHWGAWYVFLGFHAANGIARAETTQPIRLHGRPFLNAFPA
jgi:hypothetical protein